MCLPGAPYLIPSADQVNKDPDAWDHYVRCIQSHLRNAPLPPSPLLPPRSWFPWRFTTIVLTVLLLQWTVGAYNFFGDTSIGVWVIVWMLAAVIQCAVVVGLLYLLFCGCQRLGRAVAEHNHVRGL